MTRETSHRSSPAPKPEGAARLATARSAYLREAAHQKVEWRPWGAEAFREAASLDRPVLLDVGAVWCHWCHVMDEGTYSDPEVVRLLNAHYLPVKVDRDENPEVDRRYQREVGTLTGEGGWPLTAFLTPQGTTFLGGTYFPPKDTGGRPGFARLLGEVARLWKEDRDHILENVQAVQDALRRMAAPPEERQTETKEFVAETRAALREAYDPGEGGFGSAPKFPHPMATSFLFRDSLATGDPRALEAAVHTSRRMAHGGIYDHLGGGFHRYSVDEAWHIPHFEKMAVDNGHLLRAYVEAYTYAPEADFLEVVRGTLSYILTVWGSDPKGGFGASQDADNQPGDDGSYYTWTRTELRRLLTSEEFRTVQWYYGLGTAGQMPHDPEQNVLYRLLSPREIALQLKVPEEKVRTWLESARAKMIRARSARPRPYVDDAHYSSLNGILIGAISHAARLLEDPMALAAARKAADRFLAEAYEPARGVAHQLGPQGPSGWGLLEDQVDFARGLLDLAEVTQEGRYLERAREILTLTLGKFRDEGSGLLCDIAPSIYDGPRVGAIGSVVTPLEDTPHLSPNASAVLGLAHLAALTDSEEFEAESRRLLGSILPRVRRAGLFAAGAALAAAELATPAVRVVIHGDGEAAKELLRAAVRAPHPRKLVLSHPPGPPFSLPEEVGAAVGSHPSSARALICQGNRCLSPITDPREIAPRLRSLLLPKSV